MNTQELITNEEELVSNVVKDFIPASERLNFLVGFFYFSGFTEIYKNIGDKNVRILVGMDIEKKLNNKIVEFKLVNGINNNKQKSDNQIKNEFYNNLVNITNNTDFVDSVEKEKAFKIFLKKIKNGTLEIRKTRKPNHAKLYIFEISEEHSLRGQQPGYVVTGSSNLTVSGMRGQSEVNVILRGENEYTESLNLFEDLWENHSVEIVSEKNTQEFLEEVEKKIWVNKQYKPIVLYIKVLQEYFAIDESKDLNLPEDITDNYINLKYQIDAIKDTIKSLKTHNGALLADVVGLGKSIIASSAANNLDLRTIVVCPPHLIPQWEEYIYEFNFVGKVFSSGKIEDAIEYEKLHNGENLIILDEAHKYRNPDTQTYRTVHELCIGNKVLLLTATPLNNKPQDISALINLFQIPGNTTLNTVDNLSSTMRDLVTKYNKTTRDARDDKITDEERDEIVQDIAEDIRKIISPIIIRRTRSDLQELDRYREDLVEQNIRFSEVQDPRKMEYELGNLSSLYKNTLYKINPDQTGKQGFQGTRYKPLTYVKQYKKYVEKIKQLYGGKEQEFIKKSQSNLASFMKRLLVRRFESSIMSFKESLEYMIQTHKNIISWYEDIGQIPFYKKGYLPSPDDIFEIEGEDQENMFKEMEDKLNKLDAGEIDSLESYHEKGLFFIDKNDVRNKYIDKVKQDKKLLENIHDNWFEDGLPEDPKLEHCIEFLKNKLDENPDRKIVIFSEYTDTVQYISNKIDQEADIDVMSYHSKKASKTAKQKIINNFDAGIPKSKQEDKYNVLIATDAISEGYNLHRAGIILNYDIPYNPTRVIQRVGRINRINKKVFDKIYIYNYFPSVTGEQEIRAKEISTLKIDLINSLIGTDTKIFTEDQDVNSYFAEKYKEARKAEEKPSWYLKYRKFLENIEKEHPEIVEKAEEVPNRTKIRRKEHASSRNGIVFFGRKDEDYIFKFQDYQNEEEYTILPPEKGMNIFEAGLEEDSYQVSDKFREFYDKCQYKLFRNKSEQPLGRTRGKAVKKLRKIKKVLSTTKSKQYIEKLITVVKELDSIPKIDVKNIPKTGDNVSELKEKFKEIKDNIPERYIDKILDRSDKISKGEEYLILAEEIK